MATVKLTSWGKRWPIPVGQTDGQPIPIAFTLNTSYMATNDVNKVAQLEAKGITIVDAVLQIGDADTNATPAGVLSVRITDGTITKTLIHQASTGQAGGIIRPTKIATSEDAIGYTLVNKNFYVDILWTTGAATAAAATGVLTIFATGFYRQGAVTE